MSIAGVFTESPVHGGRYRRRRIKTHRTLNGWRAVSLIGFTAAAVLLLVPIEANAAIVPTVSLASAGNYSVLGGQTVTNTGPSVLNRSLGVAPGSAITGFPPGLVNAPGTTTAGDAVAQQAQSDLTAAYLNAADRPLNATTVADLSALTLVGGVYAATSKGALSLTGTVTLDGQGDPRSVFIFQTNSTLITGSGSNVSLINGAQECNVFWQVGSSATLGTGSQFAGNIMALTSIAVQTGVTVRGRALARNGAVTLDNDTFTVPTCAQSLAAPTPTVPGGASATTTAPGGPSATTTAPGGASATTAVPGGGIATTAVLGGASASTIVAARAPTPVVPPGGPTTTGHLPRTGGSVGTNALMGLAALALGAVAVGVTRRKPIARH